MKAKNTMLIYSKTSKTNEYSQLPFYLRLSENAERLEFTTKNSMISQKDSLKIKNES